MSGITPLTPPLGCATSDCLRGIKWVWQCIIVWPASSPTLFPTLKLVTSKSELWIACLCKSNNCDIAFFLVDVMKLGLGLIIAGVMMIIGFIFGI